MIATSTEFVKNATVIIASDPQHPLSQLYKRFCTDFGVLTPRTKQRGVTPSYQPFRRGVFISYQNFRKMLLCMSFFSSSYRYQGLI